MISRYTNIIDDVDFACLYDANLSRLTFLYNKFECFDIDAWDESECCRRQDLDLLRKNSQIPDKVVCCQRSLCEGTNHCHRPRNWDKNSFLQPGQLHRCHLPCSRNESQITNFATCIKVDI